MRIFSLLSALAALVTAVAAGTLPARDCVDSEIVCGAQVTRREIIGHPARDVHGLSNAELLRRGLHLKAPVLRRGQLLSFSFTASSLLTDFRLF